MTARPEVRPGFMTELKSANLASAGQGQRSTNRSPAPAPANSRSNRGIYHPLAVIGQPARRVLMLAKSELKNVYLTPEIDSGNLELSKIWREPPPKFFVIPKMPLNMATSSGEHQTP